MCPIPQGAPSLSSVLTMIPICPRVPCAHMSKKMSSCQKDVKLSKGCQMSKSQTHGIRRRFKKKIHIMRFTHIDVSFDITYDGDQKTLKKMCIESVFEQFW